MAKKIGNRMIQKQKKIILDLTRCNKTDIKKILDLVNKAIKIVNKKKKTEVKVKNRKQERC